MSMVGGSSWKVLGGAGWWPPLAVPLALTAAAYYVAAQLAFAIGTLTQQFAPFWPPNVVLLCVLLSVRRRHWPLYLAAVFPAHVLAEAGAAMPPAQLVAAYGGNVAVALLNALALERFLRDTPSAWLGSLRNALIYLLFAVALNPALVALGAAFDPMLGGASLADYWQLWWRWFLSNALGNLTLTPIFLTWFAGNPRAALALPNRARLAEAGLLAVALMVACGVAFGTPLTRTTTDLFPALVYLPIPLVLAIAARFGGRGASGAVLIVTLAALWSAMRGEPSAIGTGHSVLAVQLFLSVIAIPAIVLGALVEELRRTNDRLRSVLDGISDCYCTIGADGRITAINAKGAAWWGAPSPDELIGRNYWDAIGQGAPERDWVRRTLQSGVASSEIVASQGRWIHVHGYPSAAGLSLFFHDVTEQRAAELDASAMRELLQSSLDALSAQIAILDGEGTIIAANAAWRQRAVEDDRGLPGDNYFGRGAHARAHRRTIVGELRKLVRGELGEFRCEGASDYRKGVWLQTRGTRFGHGEALRLVLAHEDISEVKASEDALRYLTGKLMRLQDEERRRISRELHDSTAQNLLGATLGIGQALRLMPRLNSSAKAALEESRALIDQCQREIRTVSYLLHPPMLDEGGLPAALRWLSEGFSKRTDIAVELDIGGDIGRLPQPIEAALFRIAQEGLTNVHRHSGSPSAQISLRRDQRSGMAPSIVLAIADFGKGMSHHVAAAPANSIEPGGARGVGLAGMRERLHQFGGQLDVRSSARGTVLTASVPLPADDKAERLRA